MLWRLRYRIVSHTARFAAPDPGKTVPTYDQNRLIDRVSKFARRRMADRVEDLFYQACLSGDLDTAEDLHGLLLKMHQRRVSTFGHQHRINDDVLIRTAEELAWRKAARAPVAAAD